MIKIIKIETQEGTKNDVSTIMTLTLNSSVRNEMGQIKIDFFCLIGVITQTP